MITSLPEPAKTYSAPCTDLPYGALKRTLELTSPLTIVSPYHREVMTALLHASLGHKNIEQDYAHEIERALFNEQSTLFNNYAFYGTRIVTLLSQSGNISQFALTLTQKLLDGEMPPLNIALATEEELFPELFDNPNLTASYVQYLSGQLDDEYELMMTVYIRTILASTPAPKFECLLSTPDLEIYNDEGKRYQSNLVELLEQFVRGDYMNPQGRERLSVRTREVISKKYVTQIEMLRFYLSRKQETS
jgi:hypothetical protein